MQFPVRAEEELARAHQLLRKPWRFPSVCFIGLICLWEFVKCGATITAQALGLLLVTIIGVFLLLPLTMAFSVWEEVALHYNDSFTEALGLYRDRAKVYGKIISRLGIKALTCFLQKWGNSVVQQLALLLITHYTAPPKVFWPYICLLVFGFVLQWLGGTELDTTKSWCLCFATLFRLYHLVYLSNLWGMGFKGCHPITRVAFFTTTYYIKQADDQLESPICDEFESLVPNALVKFLRIQLQCPVPYPLNLIFNSSSTVRLEWMPEEGRSGILKVDHNFSTEVFGRTIPSIETDYQFRLQCCELGREKVFWFMRGMANANAVLMEKVDDISHCYSLQDTIKFVAGPGSKLIKKELSGEEMWCCGY